MGGAESVIRQGVTGYVVADNSPGRLAQGVEQLLSRPEVDAEFINSVRASVSGFSWSKIAEAVIIEGKSLIASHSNRQH